MIRYLTQELEASFLSALDFDIVAGARIYTLYQMARSGYPGMLFWVQLDEGAAPLAALAVYGNRLHIAANRKADIDELIHFIHFTGASTLSAPLFLAHLVPKTRARDSVLMRHNGGRMPDGEAQEPSSLRAVYTVLCAVDSDFARETDFDTWYGHTSHLIRHQLGFQRGIYHQERLVSTGGIYASSPRHALIGAVATLPGYRGRGHGRRIIGCLINRIVSSGRIPVTLVGDPKLIAWYESLGFEKAGQHCDTVPAAM